MNIRMDKAQNNLIFFLFDGKVFILPSSSLDATLKWFFSKSLQRMRGLLEDLLNKFRRAPTEIDEVMSIANGYGVFRPYSSI